MLRSQNQLSQQQSHPQNLKQSQERMEYIEELNFLQSSENQSIEIKSNKSLIFKLISIIMLIIIILLILMMSSFVSQSNQLISKIMNEHYQNIILQDQFQNQVIDVKNTIRSIKVIQINQKEEEDNQLNQLKGIVSKYQTSINEIESFMVRPQIIIERELNTQAQILLDLQKAKRSLQKFQNIKNEEHSIKKQSKNYKMEIPKNIWVFNENPFNLVRKLINQNRLYYSKISGYKIHFVNYDNMRTYLPDKISNNIKKGIKIIQKRLTGQSLHFASKKLILLGFLQIHGGIMLDGAYAFTQNLSWIEDIMTNQFVSRGNRFAQPKIITFYNPFQSSQRQKFKILPFQGMEESNQYVLQFPKIEEYFIAAKKGTEFLDELITKINELINDIDNFWSYNKKYHMKLDKIQDFIKNIIYAASRIMLIQKQRVLDLNHKNDYKHFAFDYYGINCMNSNYGPSKSNIIFEQNIPQINLQSYYHNIYYDLARYSYQQITAYIGNFKYLSNFNFEYFLNNFIDKSSRGKDIQIYEGSFIQRIYYPEKKHSFIIQNPEKYYINETNQIWDSLNKIVWIFQKGEEKSQWTKICENKIKQIALSSNFQLKFVNEDNIQLYLSEQMIVKIKNTIHQGTLDNIANMKSYFYRLAILYQYGGVFIEEPTLAFQNFDLLMNIGKYPSQFIFNRFGTLPKVLMFFNPYPRFQEKWDIRSVAKDKSSKAQWHQQFLHDILIAQAGNEFIGEWLDTLFQIIIMKKNEIQELFRKNKITQHKALDWTRSHVFFIDTAKYLLGRKQLLLEKEQKNHFINSAHYYKLWTINAFLTPFKLINKFNYEASDQFLNPYLYRFPRETVQSIIGEVHFQSSFIDNQPLLHLLLRQGIETKFQGKMHSHSFIKEIIQNNSGRLNNKNQKLLIN